MSSCELSDPFNYLFFDALALMTYLNKYDNLTCYDRGYFPTFLLVYLNLMIKGPGNLRTILIIRENYNVVFSVIL